MAKPYDVGPGDKVNPGDPVTVNRYTPAARVNHWITAASLVLLALSGLALFHPSLFFLTGLFGGGETTRAIHPWIGVVLFFGFLGLFLRFWRANLWKGEDGTWMRRASDVLRGHEEKLPEVGKYNAGQKLYFWMMSVLIIIMIGSGLVLWDQYFAAYTSVEQKRAAVLIHAVARHRYHLRLDRSRLCCDLGARHYPRHGEGLGHRRLGLAASSQVVERAGHRQA